MPPYHTSLGCEIIPSLCEKIFTDKGGVDLNPTLLSNSILAIECNWAYTHFCHWFPLLYVSVI